MTEIFARRITVYLVEIHPIIREALAHAIDDAGDLVVVGQAGTGAGALAETTTEQPDVVLIDLDALDRRWIELIAAFRAQLPAAKLLLLSRFDDEFYAAEARRAGAHGYLIKTADLREIIEDIRRVVGGAPLRSSIASALVRTRRERSFLEAGRGLAALTQREWQLLRLHLLRLPTREIASRLN